MHYNLLLEDYIYVYVSIGGMNLRKLRNASKRFKIDFCEDLSSRFFSIFI